MKTWDLIVIGGGAAGFYGAIQAAEMQRGLDVLILEKSNKLLSKVRVSGGGRCNVTHHCFNPIELSKHYPRGEKPLRNVFKKYDAQKTVSWFASKGVQLKTEEDGRMFPTTDNSETITNCFLTEAKKLNVNIKNGSEVVRAERAGENFRVIISSGDYHLARNILVATGGSPKLEAYSWIKDLGHTIQLPIPSLFTFNDTEKLFADLMGISVPKAQVRIASSKFAQQGPVLITHWGLSGPAVIKLSAWAAEYLYSVSYNFTAVVSWIGSVEEDALRTFLKNQKTERAKQKMYSHPLFDLPQRLWVRVCELADIPEDKVWSEVAFKNINKLLENLIRCSFRIKGKTTFKEEFVTCGGVVLDEINFDTMESKKVPGVYFAGEVLNIDGETGGFNFQSAWSTAYQAALSVVSQNIK